MDDKVINIQQARLAYPEAAWIAKCGNIFPSHVQWLYKYLSKTDLISPEKLSDTLKSFPNTTASATILKNKATSGSGKTMSGVPIHEKVSMDWLQWAISKKVWNLLYTREKVDSTNGGGELVTNEVKAVLNIAVDEGMLVSYRITSIKIDRANNNISIKYVAELEHTIYGVEIGGSLYY